MTWERQLNERTGLELALSNATRDPLSLSAKATRVIGYSSKGSIEFVLRNHFSSGLNVQAQRKLSDTITGVLQLGFGVEQSLVVQLQHQDRFTPPVYKSKREQEDEYYRTCHPAAAATAAAAAEHAAAEHAEQHPRGPQGGPSAEQSEAPPRTQRSSGSAMLFASGVHGALVCTAARGRDAARARGRPLAGLGLEPPARGPPASWSRRCCRWSCGGPRRCPWGCRPPSLPPPPWPRPCSRSARNGRSRCRTPPTRCSASPRSAPAPWRPRALGCAQSLRGRRTNTETPEALLRRRSWRASEAAKRGGQAVTVITVLTVILTVLPVHGSRSVARHGQCRAVSGITVIRFRS